MDVEKACIALLPYFLNLYDPQKNGYTIDIGVGTCNFYCEAFSEYGYKTVAIEPIPSPKLKALCKEKNIQLVEACVYESDGEIEIYTGEYEGDALSDLSSVKKNWWGATTNSQMVKSYTLTTLLNELTIKDISYLKIDTEGSELEIIKQLNDISIERIPEVVEFEYGGGGLKKSGKGGWDNEFFSNTLQCIQVLKNLKFQVGIRLDSNANEVQFLNWLNPDETLEEIFNEDSEYGNLIFFKSKKYDEAEVSKIVHRSDKHGYFSEITSKISSFKKLF